MKKTGVLPEAKHEPADNKHTYILSYSQVDAFYCCQQVKWTCFWGYQEYIIDGNFDS